MGSAAEGSVLKLLPAGPSGTLGPRGLECGFTTRKEARKCRSKRCGWKKRERREDIRYRGGGNGDTAKRKGREGREMMEIKGGTTFPNKAGRTLCCDMR